MKFFFKGDFLFSSTFWGTDQVKLGDVISIKHGYAFKGEGISDVDNGIVLVTPGNFAIGGGFQEKKMQILHL